MADRVQGGIPHTEPCDSLRCRCYLDGLYQRHDHDLTWGGGMTCFHCGEMWVVGSHIIGSTTHVCPKQVAHIDGTECAP